MKRRFWFVSAILAVTMTFVACGKRDDDATVANVAATNNLLRSSCLNQPYVVNNQLLQTTTNCGMANLQNNTHFQQYPVANGYYRGYADGFVDGFTACPQGTIPTYHPRIGLTCLRTHYFSSMGWDMGSQYQFPTWQWNSLSFNFKFHGHVHYSSHMKGGYHNRVMSSCMKGTATCPAGHCMAAPGSRIGVCSNFGGRYNKRHMPRPRPDRPQHRPGGHKRPGKGRY